MTGVFVNLGKKNRLQQQVLFLACLVGVLQVGTYVLTRHAGQANSRCTRGNRWNPVFLEVSFQPEHRNLDGINI